ncbi:MAG: VanZ family protein, partial [Sediminibacterium sp.]
THDGPANLVPLRTILPYLLGQKGLIIGAINLIGNIILLIPLGLLVSCVNPTMTWKKSIAIAIAAGFAIEGMQALLHVGIFDIDDIILNALGVIIGCGAFIILEKKRRRVYGRMLIITIFILIVIAAMAVFYSVDIYEKHSEPAHFQPVVANRKTGNIDNGKPRNVQGIDPCRGTGGTGQIVSVGNSSIVIKRHDSTSIIIIVTTQTIIRNSAAVVSKADLKPGNRVTIVADVNRDGPSKATAIFVCNDAGPQPAR